MWFRSLSRLILFCLLGLLAPLAAAGGSFWCNTRFLDPAGKPFDAHHLAIAQRGYVYAVAAALALQQDNAEGRANHFVAPPRLREVDRPRRDRSGFEVATFELHATPDGPLQEVIVAFAGSNDDADWDDTNFGNDTRQYTLARRYVQQIAARPQYRGIRLVATGFSLGGALAVHVTKHRETRALVAETWAFNPSPKTWVGDQVDRRIWLVATANDGLHLARKLATALIPGVGEIGAPLAQRAEGFYLLDANPVISHYRWVLTRNLLHVADLALRIAQHSDAPTEPLEILQASSFSACRRPAAPVTARLAP